ncbi:hypothetical protein [Hydrogenibacillus sp. N12]|uniref:hypothetical protein n=1 Tax=Hydrogenibacillus sp. N12 TaxID=2866627 RepID=UPI001C7CFF0C|nr:hypothetical protein [Hydrogenibacillus sp. N12]QZA32494.1 hypothetical protein K2M58_09295 [Hydrogenibacillus sp. N12]
MARRQKEPSVPTATFHLSAPSGHFWIDLGLAVLHAELGPGPHPVDAVLAWLTDRYVQPTGNTGEYYDRSTESLRSYPKKNWVYPLNFFIKVTPDSGEKVKRLINGQEKAYPTQPPVYRLELKFSARPGRCTVCGAEAPTTQAGMWVFPFAVAPNNFGNFYSMTKQGIDLCSRCALAGAAGYLGWLWRAAGREYMHFFIFHGELSTMKGLYENHIRPAQLKATKSGNASMAFYGPYVHESTLGLLLDLFARLRASDGSAASENGGNLGATQDGGLAILRRFFDVEATVPVPLTLYAIHGTFGQALEIKSIRTFSRLEAHYGRYERWFDRLSTVGFSSPGRVIGRIFRQFVRERRQPGGDRSLRQETIWRDRVARAVLTEEDPFPAIEQFLYEERARDKDRRPLVAGTLVLFDHYAEEVLRMNPSFLKMLSGFGYSLGKKAFEEKEMGVLYMMRNAKNIQEFYRVLNDIQFRLKMTVPEALLMFEAGDRIAGVPWIRLKTMLAIYAMNAYLRAENGGKEEETEGEALDRSVS